MVMYNLPHAGCCSKLITYLNSYMIHKCVVKKLETILCCNGGDILVSLSSALGASQSQNYEPAFQSQMPSTGATLQRRVS